MAAKKHDKVREIIIKIDNAIGHWAFVFGVSLAVVLAILDNTQLSKTWGMVLLGFGIVIGILNITREETNSFLIAASALILANTANIEIVRLWDIGFYLYAIIKNLMVVFTPAAVIVALESIYRVAVNR